MAVFGSSVRKNYGSLAYIMHCSQSNAPTVLLYIISIRSTEYEGIGVKTKSNMFPIWSRPKAGDIFFLMRIFTCIQTRKSHKHLFYRDALAYHARLCMYAVNIGVYRLLYIQLIHTCCYVIISLTSVDLYPSRGDHSRKFDRIVVLIELL